ncbi:O-antigen polysaccharide polymerase Wzy [Granulimonas faecalis]|uniref:O-antigen polysaccharide polymerase Wzy n=1 Tax=Granulimonas faecalis TaxID=2894155 RepID=UPI003512BEF5
MAIDKLKRNIRRLPRWDCVYFGVVAAYILLFILFTAGSWLDPGSDYRTFFFPWVVGFLVVELVGLVLVGRVNLFDATLWFVVLANLFMFGHVFLKGFALSSTLEWDPSVYFEEWAKSLATAYAALAIMGISTASVAYKAVMNAHVPAAHLKRNKEGNATWLIWVMGLVCLLIGLVAGIWSSSAIIAAAQESGTYEIFTTANVSGLADDFAFLIVPGAALVLASRKLSWKKAGLLTLGIVAYYCVVMMLSGSRKMQSFALISVVLCYVYCYFRTKLKIKDYILLLVVGFLFLNLMFVIRDERTSLVNVPGALLASLVSPASWAGLLGETFAESGLTFYSLAGIVQTVPSVFPYELGLTFAKTLPSALPIGWLVGDLFDSAASTYVINRYIGVPVGASLIGDFYWNWGFVGGVAFSAAFGLVIAWVQERMLRTKAGVAFYFCLFSVLEVGVRSGVFELFRPLVVALLVPSVVFWWLVRKDRKDSAMKVMLHGATDFDSSNFGDFLYAYMMFNHITELLPDTDVCFYRASNYIKKHTSRYQPSREFKIGNADALVYIPGGYFGEGHNARLRDNIFQFYRFMPVGIKAVALDKKIAVVGIGAGPINSLAMKRAAKTIIGHSSVVTTRDHISYEALIPFEGKCPIEECGDLILTLDIADLARHKNPLEDMGVEPIDGPVLLVHYNHSREALEKFAVVSRKWLKRHPEGRIVVTSDQVLDNEDELFGEFVSSVPNALHYRYDDPFEIIDLLSSVDAILTCKLHVGVVAAMLSKPVICAAEHPGKTKRFYGQIGFESNCLDLYRITADELSDAVERLWQQPVTVSSEAQELAERNWGYLDTFLSNLGGEE